MKVQTSDDAKLNNNEKSGEVPTSRSTSSGEPYTVDYEIRQPPAQQAKYVNLSKLVLLILAIIATFLACLIFARDLWGQKNVVKEELGGHRAPLIMSPASPDHFPFKDLLNDMNDAFDPYQILGKDEEDESKDDPHLVKTKKITFKLIPKDSEEFPGAPFGMKRIGGPNFDDGFLDDILKNVMSMLNRPGARWEPSFGDLPFFDGPNNARPINPKLIIVRKFPPSQQHENDVFKNLLPMEHPADKYKPLVERFPLFPVIRQVPVDDRPLDSETDSLLSKIISDFGVGGPIGRFLVKNSPAPNTQGDLSGSAGWNEYKSIVSKLAQQVDTILDSIDALKQTTTEELNKIKDPSEPEVPKSGNPPNVFLSSALEYMTKMATYLTEVSIVIKTEDGAMDLVNKTDSKSLINTIESFLKNLNEPLGEVFTTSTSLTKMAGKNGDSQPVLQGIVSIASKIVDFGKIIYEDLSKLSSTIKDPSESGTKSHSIPSAPVEESKPNSEPAQSSNAPTDESEKKIEPIFNSGTVEAAQPAQN